LPGEVFDYSLQVRWSDSDRLGHVNNTRFVEYLQEARAHFVTRCFVDAEGARGATVVRTLTVDFLRPLFDDSGPLNIAVSVIRIGRTSFGIRHRVYDVNGVLCAQADAVMVAFDLDSQSPRSLTGNEKNALGAYLDDDVESAETE
jgi:acyl-CoA thioester hydrolase